MSEPQPDPLPGLCDRLARSRDDLLAMLADVETSALDQALQGLSNYDNRVRGVACDVADPDSVERAAQAGTPVYGVTTGLGAKVVQSVDGTEAAAFSLRRPRRPARRRRLSTRVRPR